MKIPDGQKSTHPHLPAGYPPPEARLGPTLMLQPVNCFCFEIGPKMSQVTFFFLKTFSFILNGSSMFFFCNLAFLIWNQDFLFNLLTLEARLHGFWCFPLQHQSPEILWCPWFGGVCNDVFKEMDQTLRFGIPLREFYRICLAYFGKPPTHPVIPFFYQAVLEGDLGRPQDVTDLPPLQMTPRINQWWFQGFWEIFLKLW